MYDTQQQIHTQKVQKKKTAEILTERGNVLCRSYQINFESLGANRNVFRKSFRF